MEVRSAARLARIGNHTPTPSQRMKTRACDGPTDPTKRVDIFRKQVNAACTRDLANGRYLIHLVLTVVSTGHGEAAVKLQRDWMIDPQTLPFADNVKSHALVALVQKGLQYHEVERSLKDVRGHLTLHSPLERLLILAPSLLSLQSRSQLHASAAAFFFGPTTASKSSPGRDDGVDEGPTSTTARKPRPYERHHATNGLVSLDLPANAPAAKRQRRTNGNGVDAATNGDAMQLDHNGYHDHPAETTSPQNHYSSAEDGATANGMDVDDVEREGPRTPTPEPPRTLTNGQSIGIQSEKSIDLSSQTAITTLSSPSQILMHIAWNPQDPTILATAGEALCRIWNTTKSASLSEPYYDILPPSEESLASTMAWSPNGEVIAVATRNAQSSDWVGAVSLWTKHGKAIEELPATQEMVIMLKWNDLGTRLLGITSSGERSSSVIVWDVNSPQTYAPCQIDGELRDAAWMDDGRFLVCGRGIIAASYFPSSGSIALDLYRDETIATKTWTHIRYDVPTASVICASEEESLLVRLNSHPSHPDLKVCREAHTDQITALELQPPTSAVPPNPGGGGRILATVSLDGTTKIWSTPSLDLLTVLTPGSISPPATALAFTPDGQFLATASSSRISIWNPAEQGPPKAIWKGDLGKVDQGANNTKKAMLTPNGSGVTGVNNEHPAPDRDSAIGDVAEEDVTPGCSLSWDAEGRKLVLGLNRQVRSDLTDRPVCLSDSLLDCYRRLPALNSCNSLQEIIGAPWTSRCHVVNSSERQNFETVARAFGKPGPLTHPFMRLTTVGYFRLIWGEKAHL